MNSVTGIDCGVTGAICWLHKNPGGFDIKIFDMPIKTKFVGKKRRNEVDPFELTNIIQSFGGQPRCIIERPHAMPKNGSIAGFGLGHSLGTVVGVCAGSRLPIDLVSPQKWKRALGLSSDKAQSLDLARQLYPQCTDLLTRKKDDGRAEALLLAHWGMKNGW